MPPYRPDRVRVGGVSRADTATATLNEKRKDVLIAKFSEAQDLKVCGGSLRRSRKPWNLIELLNFC